MPERPRERGRNLSHGLPCRRIMTRRLRQVRRRLAGPILAALVLAGGHFGFAQAPPDYRLNKDFLAAFGRDLAAVATSPLHWGGRDLGRFALISGATLATVACDRRIRNWMQDHRTDWSEDASLVFEKIGNGAYLLSFTAVLYAAGEIWSSRGLRRTALLSVESLAAASALTAVMKFAVGRARPYTGEGPYAFRTFSTKSAHNSFPSGHAAAAFAVATTIALETRGVAVDLVAYSVATLVGLSRIHDDKHWASSVIAGGALACVLLWHSRQPIYGARPSRAMSLNIAQPLSYQRACALECGGLPPLLRAKLASRRVPRH